MSRFTRHFQFFQSRAARFAYSACALILALISARAAAQAGGFKVDSQWVFATDAAHPGTTLNAAVQFTIGGGYHFQSNEPTDEYLFPTILDVKPPDGFTVREIVYPKPVMFEVLGFEEPLPVFDHEFAIGVSLDVSDDAAPGEYKFNAKLNYQACDDKQCLQPTSLDLQIALKVVASDVPLTKTGNPILDGIAFTGLQGQIVNSQPTPANTASIPAVDPNCDVLVELGDFTVLGTAGGYLGVDDFIAFVDSAEKGEVKKNLLADKGPLAILLLVIVGGFLLNLTPCVLPLIPINLAIIGAGAQAGSRVRGFALGGTYGLAMAVVYGSLGLIVTLTAASFGTINSTVWFNIAIAVLFVFLALAMFDIISIDFTKFQSNIDASHVAKKGTFALAFFMGGVSALLAGACVAPVVIQVIVYSGDQYARGETTALALPFFLGIGMALPWPFAGAGLSCLPKPGMWMVRVKQAMGVFILAFAGYYGYLGWEIWDSKRVDPALVQDAVAEQLEGGWTASLCQGLATAKAENKPVLIDMWATWCKNCLAMDKTTFKDNAVTSRLDGYVKVKFQAQDLTKTPNEEMLDMFGQIGLPAYAILQPKNSTLAITD